MPDLTWDEFERVDLRAATITSAEPLEGARMPAYKLMLDIGPEFGIRQSSAQLTTLYTAEELVGRQVMCVVNFPPKRIAGFKSEALVTGFYREDGAVVLVSPDSPLPNGAKLG